jgi:ATP-dependent Lon protease
LDDLDRKRNDNFAGYMVRKVEIVDPYIRQFYQRRNLKEPLEVIPSHFDCSSSEAGVRLLTLPDEYPDSQQTVYLNRIAESLRPMGIDFSYHLDEPHTIHARHVVIDGGWDVMLDQGLGVRYAVTFKRSDCCG